jgi:HlyD family secretion protein
VDAALVAKREELALLTGELARSKDYLQKGFTTRKAVWDLEKDVVRARGEVGSLAATKAELNAKAAEQRLKIHASPFSVTKLSAEQLNLSRQQSRKLIDRRDLIVDRLSKLDKRAPVSGMIFDSKIMGPRSIIEAAKPIMYIVPDGGPNLVVVRVEARDIEQVHVGQQARLRFTTFSRRWTPIVAGRVTAVSADAFRDEKTQTAYYFVDVKLIPREMQKLEDVELISGMPVEAFFTTESRSPASYVTKPIADFFAKAFRD